MVVPQVPIRGAGTPGSQGSEFESLLTLVLAPAYSMTQTRELAWSADDERESEHQHHQCERGFDAERLARPHGRYDTREPERREEPTKHAVVAIGIVGLGLAGFLRDVQWPVWVHAQAVPKPASRARQCRIKNP